MAKFSGVGAGRSADVAAQQAELVAGSPVEDLQKNLPPTSSTLSSIIAQQVAQPEAEAQAAESLPQAFEAGIEETQALQQEQERNVVPDLRTRFEQAPDRVDTYQRQKVDNNLPRDDGGLFERAGAMGKAVEEGRLTISKQLDKDAYAALKEGAAPVTPGSMTIPNIITTMGAQQNAINPETGRQQTTYDPKFWAAASVVTENFLATTITGEGVDAQELQQNLGPGAEAFTENPNQTVVTKAQGNTMLGQEINREYQRIRNREQGLPPDQYEELTPQQATVLGDAIKEAYAQQNPDIVKRVSNGDGSQVYYQLTPEGSDKFTQGTAARKRMFPKQHVRPAKQATPKGALLGEVGKLKKGETGTVGKRGKRGKLNEAKENLNSVPNVVDAQRLRILYSTVLPVLADQKDNPNIGVFSEINNVGPSKERKFAAAQAKAEQDGIEYDANVEMSKLKDTLAQSIYGIARERKGANHLTYYTMAYNGRLAPQQTHFDPTTSKAVRFVTRNATPSKVEPGGRVERNIRQMYAMMLVKGADTKLPEVRDRMLRAAEPQLIRWGKRLREVLDASMTDAQAEAISQAIEAGTPITDPNFPQFQPLALDPEKDADLIRVINGKGEDGPHFIDGVIDFLNYYENVKMNNRPYHSYFNAYIDGKTNGLAANGIQMGSKQVALTTGVTRNQDVDLLDDGDIRDQLKDVLLSELETNGLMGVGPEVSTAWNDVAKAVFSWRDLNKATTMTFGYGQEMDAFAGKIEETVGELYEIARSGDKELIAQHGLETFADSMDQIRSESKEENPDKHLAQTLLNPYSAALTQVLSKEGIAARALMKGAGTIAAIAGVPLAIKSYSGMDLVFGGNVTTGIEETQTYQLDGKTQSAQIYGSRATAAAPKMVGGEAQIGRKAIGGSVPGPVQSLDAETIALSVTGKSWDKLKKASGGNPYFHSIYDAIKMDANGYDVVLEEVNANWLKASMEWSYLKEMHDASKKIVNEVLPELKSLGKTPVDVTQTGRWAMTGYLLSTDVTQKGGEFPKKLMLTLKQTMDKKDNETADDYNTRVFEEVFKLQQKYGQYMNKDELPANVVHEFFKDYLKLTNLGPRFRGMIEQTEKNKKELAKEIRKHGPVYQYYAH